MADDAAAAAAAAAAAKNDWKTTLPEDMRGAPALKDIKDIPALTKSYIEAQSALGGAVRLPSKEAGEEGRKAFRERMLAVGKDYGLTVLPGEDEKEQEAFYAALGRPPEAKAYEIPDAQAEGLVFDETETNTFRAVAHKAGLTGKQFKRVVADMARARQEGVREVKAKFDTGHGELKKEWGQAYDERRGDVAKRLELQKAPASLVSAFKEGLVDAESTRWLYAVLSALGDEPHELASQGKPGGVKLSPDEAMARVAEVEARINAMNPGDPEYSALVKRRVELIEIANG